MTHVTPQTAAALKDAGFPQRNPEIDQFWYLGSNLKWVMSHDLDRPGHFNMATIGSQFAASFAPGQLLEYMAFAPTAEDILSDLGEGWSLSPVKADGKTSWCVTFMEDGFVRNHQWHEIAAEALASAYLSLSNPAA